MSPGALRLGPAVSTPRYLVIEREVRLWLAPWGLGAESWVAMKRLNLLLAAAALVLVGCGPAANPSDFNTGMTDTGINGRPTGLEAMSQNIRNGTIPPEAILATVYFGFDRYTVEVNERAKLDALAGAASGKTLLLAGYTDHVGTEEYNLGLSDRRSQSVAEYLVRLGLSRSKMEVIALGEQQATQGASAAVAAKDRRVHIVDANYQGGATSSAPAAPFNGGPPPAPVGL